MTGEKRPKVVAVVANVKQFRATFYAKLEKSLASRGVDLLVVYSAPDPVEQLKSDSIDLTPPLGMRVRRRYFFSNRVLLQFVPLSVIAAADLVIVVQATGYILNYPLLLLSRLGLKRVAFWGHGYNRRGLRDSLSERLKRSLASWSSWWFAYTRSAVSHLEALGVPADRITTIENAIDTTSFRDLLSAVDDSQIADLRNRLGIQPGQNIGLYCGSLYPEKRLDYLLEAAADIFAARPEFRLLVIGDGPEADVLRAAESRTDHVIYLGPLFGREKAICFRMADVALYPGLVGLGILDCFAAGLPFVTTADALHSPEIDYLSAGENGLIVSGPPASFAEAVLGLLSDQNRREMLCRGAVDASRRYTVENMVSNVSDGIVRALGLLDAEGRRDG